MCDSLARRSSFCAVCVFLFRFCFRFACYTQTTILCSANSAGKGNTARTLASCKQRQQSSSSDDNDHVKQSSPAKGSTTIAIYLACPFSSAAAHCKKRNEEGRGEGGEYVCLPWHYSLSSTYQSEPLFFTCPAYLFPVFNFSFPCSPPLWVGNFPYCTLQRMYVFHKCCMQHCRYS